MGKKKSAAAAYAKEQAEAVAAGEKLAGELELTNAALRDTLEEKVRLDLAVRAFEAKLAEKDELIERLKAEAKESRDMERLADRALSEVDKRYKVLEAEKAVSGADPEVLTILQNVIRTNPNCDTTEEGLMHRQCVRGKPCWFRKARQLLRGHGMEI